MRFSNRSLLVGMLKYIADCQHVQTKLRQALKEGFSAAVAESRLPTAVEIFKANIPYLDATIEESLRLGTPAPMVAREAVEDTVLLGHNIPKGCTLLISQAGPSYLTKPADIPDSVRSETSRTKQRAGSWDPEDMEEFKPERWLKQGKNGETVYDPQAGPMLTFSLGPRGCFGRKLAYLEIRLILTLVFWSFNLRKLDGELASYETEESVTRMPKHCYVGLDIL
jgi:cytochrome P450